MPRMLVPPMLLGLALVVSAVAPTSAQTKAQAPGADGQWGQVPFEAGLRDPNGASRLESVAAGLRGIVAIGTSPTGAAAWHSVDGLTWQRAIPPRSWTKTGRSDRYPTLEDVVATDEGFVVVGTEHDGPKRTHGNVGSVWTSQDGLIWRRTARGVGPYLTRVIEHDGRLFAVSGRVHRQIPGAIWASDDGTEWEQVHQAPADGSVEVIASDGEVVVAGSHEAMAWSTNGRDWQAAPIEPGGTYDVWLEDATAFESGFIAVGSRDGVGAAWRSEDGRAWAAVAATIDTGAYITHLRAVAPLPGGGVLVAAGTDEIESFLYRSGDGETWSEPIFGVDVRDLGGDGPFADIEIDDGRALIVGYQPDGPRGVSAAVWMTPPPVAMATEGRVLTACPGPRPTIDELVVMDAAARIDCFGDRELTFRAWLVPHTTGDLEFYGQPHWLTAGEGGMRALPVDGDSGTMSLVLHVRPRDRRSLDLRAGRWAFARGHFDDRSAQRCPDHWRERCRQSFVVRSITPAASPMQSTTSRVD